MQLHIFEKSVLPCGIAAWRGEQQVCKKKQLSKPCHAWNEQMQNIYAEPPFTFLSGSLFSERLNFLYVSQFQVSPKLTRELTLFSSTQPQ